MNALAAGEAGGGSCGLAAGVEGAVGGRAAAFDELVLLTGAQVLNVRNEAAGCAGDGEIFVCQASLIQKFGQPQLHLVDADGYIGGGQLFAAQFDEQGLGLGRLLGFIKRYGVLCPIAILPAQLGLVAVLKPGVFLTLALLDVEFGDAAGLVAHGGEEFGAFGDADGAAGVENVEGLALAEYVVVGGGDEATLDAGFGFGVVEIAQGTLALDVGQLKVVDTVFDLLLAVDFAVCVDAVEVDGPDFGALLEVHDDALQPVGDFDADGVEADAAGLLEVGELGNLLAVEPDFPAEAPGAECGRFPVVLDEADVVAVALQADGFEAAEVELLGVTRIRFEDDLVLCVHLHAVGVFGVAAVVGAEGGLDVGDVPGFGAEDAQDGGRVHGAGAQFFAVRLPDLAAVRGPVFVQTADGFLH